MSLSALVYKVALKQDRHAGDLNILQLVAMHRATSMVLLWHDRNAYTYAAAGYRIRDAVGPGVNTFRTSKRKSKESADFGCRDAAHTRPRGSIVASHPSAITRPASANQNKRAYRRSGPATHLHARRSSPHTHVQCSQLRRRDVRRIT